MFKENQKDRLKIIIDESKNSSYIDIINPKQQIFRKKNLHNNLYEIINIVKETVKYNVNE